MISLVTYTSGTYKVKGYLALPGGYEVPSHLDAVEVACCLSRHDTQGGPPLKLPSQPSSSSLPLLIYCRGGYGQFGKVKLHWLEQFVQYGFAVFAPCYRGNEGGEGRDEFGGAEGEDVLAGLRLAASLPMMDASRVAIMGFSRGSINATQAAIACSGNGVGSAPSPLRPRHSLGETSAATPTVRSLVLWAGVSDLSVTYEERPDLRRLLKRATGGTPARRPDAYRLRSPIKLIDDIHIPVLIMHGTDDEQVSWGQGQRLLEALQGAGKRVDLHRYDGLGHHMPPNKHHAALGAMFQWIRAQQS